MTVGRANRSAEETLPANLLNQVLGQSERVKTIVEECADELSSVNSDLRQEFNENEVLSGVGNVLEKSEAVENKVQLASDELSSVNQALKVEVKFRHVLEGQLETATRQGEEARHASLHDPLTGLPNRALFDDRLEHELAHSKRHELSFAVMFMDLNDFKEINDTHGHDVGDIVLLTIAQRLKQITREDDTVCRLGGDEFLYLLTEVQGDRDTTTVVEKIIKAVCVPCDIQIRDLSISLNISASIGISMFPKHGATADSLLDAADKAMYRAKRDKSGYSFAL